MERYLTILKGLCLILLLFVLVSTIGVSDSSTEDSVEEVDTITNIFERDYDNREGIQVTAEISENGEKTITDEDG